MRLSRTIRVVGALAILAGALYLARPLLLRHAAERIEQALRSETGLAWKIAGGLDLCFEPRPCIVLHDLSVGDESGAPANLFVRAREIRLTGDFGPLFGKAGAAGANAQGLSVRLPMGNAPRADSGAAAPNAAFDRVENARLAIRGAKFDVAGATRSAVASAETATLSLDLAPRAETTRASLEIETERSLIKLDSTRTNAAGAAAAVNLDVAPRLRDGARLTARARIESSGALLRADAITGSFDGAPFSGAVAFDRTEPPGVVADIRLDSLIVAGDKQVDQPRPAGFETAALLRTSDLDRIDAILLDGAQADVSIVIDRLQLGSLRLGQVKARAMGKSRMLDLNVAAESFYEGAARARYVLASSEDRTPLHQLSLSVTRGRLAGLLSDLTHSHVVDGTATARIEAQARGARPDDILRSAVGSADVSVVEGSLSPRGLLDIAGVIPSPKSQGGAGGGLGFSRLAGTFALRDGRAQSTDLRLDFDLIGASGAGAVDYVAQTVDFTFKPDLSGKGAGKGAGLAGGLDIPIRVVGPWSDPQASADFGDVLANPGKALQTLQDIGSTLTGKGVGGKAADGKAIGGKGADGADLSGLGDALGGLFDSLFAKPGADGDTGGRTRRR